MSDEEEEIQLGPCMSALTPLQRRFVLAMLSNPLASPPQWARDAGYEPGGSDREASWRLTRNPKIDAAANEVARAHLSTLGPMLGIGVMMSIAKNPNHKDQLKAAAMLANRSGFHETTEHKVTVDRKDRSPTGVEKRIARAMEKLAKMGRLPAALAPPVEGEFKVIDEK